MDAVETPDDGRAGGLDAFVETGEVGEFAAVVGYGAHEPVGFFLDLSLWVRMEVRKEGREIEDEMKLVNVR